MPFANFKIPQGMMTGPQKADLIHRTTDLLVSFFGEAARPHTMVLVDEVVDGGYGRADEVFDLEALRRLRAHHETGPVPTGLGGSAVA